MANEIIELLKKTKKNIDNIELFNPQKTLESAISIEEAKKSIRLAINKLESK